MILVDRHDLIMLNIYLRIKYRIKCAPLINYNNRVRSNDLEVS